MERGWIHPVEVENVVDVVPMRMCDHYVVQLVHSIVACQMPQWTKFVPSREAARSEIDNHMSIIWGPDISGMSMLNIPKCERKHRINLLFPLAVCC
jgi:hypothetical protein